MSQASQTSRPSGIVQRIARSYIARRLVLAVFTLLAAATIIFFAARILPGDPARIMAGLDASEEVVARYRIELGLDRPILVQYGQFLLDTLRGEMGTSIRLGRPVAEIVGQRLGNTFVLACSAIVIAIAVGIPLGMLAATRRTRLGKALVSALCTFLVSAPNYWLGLILIVWFAVGLRWFPPSGYAHWGSIVLPAVTLAAFPVGLIARMTASGLNEAIKQDFVRTARAKGASERRVFAVHALRNALIPVVTVLGLEFGTLLGGAVVVEGVFGWPGVGQLLLDSLFSRDYPTLQCLILLSAATFVIANLLTDMLYARIDPRVRVGK